MRVNETRGLYEKAKKDVDIDYILGEIDEAAISGHDVLLIKDDDRYVWPLSDLQIEALKTCGYKVECDTNYDQLTHKSTTVCIISGWAQNSKG